MIDGKKAKRLVERYFDTFITSNNPLGEAPTEKNWAKPDLHPCSKCFTDLSEKDWDQDYIDLANRTLQHKCKKGYCLKSTLVNGEKKT